MRRCSPETIYRTSTKSRVNSAIISIAGIRRHKTQLADAIRKQIQHEVRANQALWRILPLLCERGTWNVGNAWVKNANGEFEITASFNDKEHSWQFDAPELVAQVFESKQPRWEGNCLLVPAIADGYDDPTAVLEFQCEENRPENRAMVQDFAVLSGHLLSAELDDSFTPKIDRKLASSEQLQQQMNEVYTRLVRTGSFHPSVVFEDTYHYYNTLGLPAEYFERFSVQEIAQHVEAFIAAKKLAASRDPTIGDDPYQEEINVRVKTKNGEVYMVPLERKFIMSVEDYCDVQKYQSAVEKKGSTIAIARYVTSGPAVPYGNTRLAMYTLDKETFPETKADLLDSDMAAVATKEFLERRPDYVQARYQNYLDDKLARLSPLLKQYPAVDGITPVVIGFRATTDKGQLSLGVSRILTELLGDDVVVQRKYTNRFANGLIFYSLYLECTDQARIDRFLQEAALLSLIPRSNAENLIESLTKGELNADEFAYAASGSNFVYYFMPDKTEGLDKLRNALGDDEVNSNRLRRVTAQLHRQALPTSRIDAAIMNNPKVARELYADFQKMFDPRLNENKKQKPVFNTQLQEQINKTVTDPIDREILTSFLSFNQAVSKTNFYNERKSTIAFRLEPSTFFDGLKYQYPETPYGIFLLMSADFVGFHVRFMPVARGGIRVIKSETPQKALVNRQTLFTENYGLAHTQNRKNKDIPEFGSKGTILLEEQSQKSRIFAFSKYMSGMMDLLLPAQSGAVDHHGKEEILFFGPDEKTADVMAQAAHYAHDRGYNYWKACTTGKPPSMGGIPHDTYGMTTRSVREFVNGVLEDAGEDPKLIRKVQTGGPDGDLGSNEIKQSREVTVAVVDVTGVVFDPNGLDQDELERLAKERATVDMFNQDKLSSQGKFVDAQAKESITLPDGTVVENAELFRDQFHYLPQAEAELFVPCGGRPEAVNSSNVHNLINDDGTPKYKYIVEGANLFITEEARSTLAQAGAILFKDASTNKGGVTSSSLEVLAALSMTDAEHKEHMCAPEDWDGKDLSQLPDFYNRYTDEVIKIIENNARAEYKALRDAHKETGIPYHKLTDILSEKINDLNISCQESDLIDDVALRNNILREAFPKELQDLLGLETLVERLPQEYIKAVLGYYIASQFVYQKGMYGNEFKFYEFMKTYST